MTYVTLAAEGIVDAAVIERLCSHVGLVVARRHVCRGKGDLDRRLDGFNRAGALSPWVAIRDLNHEAECAPALVASLLPMRSVHISLRIAVPEIEAWLLADRQGIARFLGLKGRHVPIAPEALTKAKRMMVTLAQTSRKGEIRRDMVPPVGISADVGPAYTARLIEYARGVWNPHVAAENSQSLARCIVALRRISSTYYSEQIIVCTWSD